jgi:hypothetical protein
MILPQSQNSGADPKPDQSNLPVKFAPSMVERARVDLFAVRSAARLAPAGRSDPSRMNNDAPIDMSSHADEQLAGI